MAKSTKVKRTPEQQAIKDHIKNECGNLIVQARAGTGKSTTIEDVAPRGSVILCFNNAPAKEMEERLAGSGRSSSTFHKYGKNLFPKGSFFDKYGKVVKDLTKETLFHGNNPNNATQWSLYNSVQNGISWIKCQNIDPNCSLSDVETTLSDPRVELELSVDEVAEPVLKVFQKTLEKYKGKFSVCEYYDYDDMLYKPRVHNWGAEYVEHLFVDEAQDMNPLRMHLAQQWGINRYAVGDEAQAIYAFNGSMTESLSEFAKLVDATSLPLTTCWRCPANHLQYVRDTTIVSDIQAAPGRADGPLEFTDLIDYDTLPEDGALILCRVNAPLIRHYLKLRRVLTQQVVFYASDSIVQMLKSLVGWNANQYTDSYWYDAFQMRIEKKIKYCKSPMQASVLRDYKEVIEEMLNCRDYNILTLGDFHAIFETEFKRPEVKDIKPNAIRLSSIHSSKGLEHNNVIFYGTSLLPHPMAKEPWERKQEENLLYVARTRSKYSLTEIAIAE